jgi:uncharacterized protein (TIRG00374 family)
LTIPQDKASLEPEADSPATPGGAALTDRAAGGRNAVRGDDAPVPVPPAARKVAVSRIALRVIALGVTAAALYFLWPRLLEVFAAWEGLREVDPIWYLLMLAAEVASLACIWALLRTTLGLEDWFRAATSQLAATAFSRVVPGGAAAGGGLQYQMLTSTGLAGPRVATALTTVSLLVVVGLAGLPLFAVPALLTGLDVNDGLANAVFIGSGAFALLALAGVVAVVFDRPLAVAAGAAQWLRNLVTRGKPRKQDLAQVVLHERDQTVRALGPRWKKALLLTVARPLLDFVALLAALLAVGARPYPSLVLLAYVVAGLLSMIPITPGGLGFVEAGLAATLGLVGVSASEATLATLAYRLVSYWLPIPAGGLAYVLFKRRLARTRLRGAET